MPVKIGSDLKAEDTPTPIEELAEFKSEMIGILDKIVFMKNINSFQNTLAA